jgi:heme-degrading monooxygenase HmoA
LALRIEETHSNGSKIVVSGWRARRIVEAWRASQEPRAEDPDKEQPKVVGTHASADRAGQRRYETDATFSYNPVVFGFVPNEVNERN